MIEKIIEEITKRTKEELEQMYERIKNIPEIYKEKVNEIIKMYQEVIKYLKEEPLSKMFINGEILVGSFENRYDEYRIRVDINGSCVMFGRMYEFPVEMKRGKYKVGIFFIPEEEVKV
jgi:DNA-binding ferritin-like protein (Dps family)